MSSKLMVAIEEDVYEKFSLATKLNNELEADVIENFMKSYISKTFNKFSQVYRSSDVLPCTKSRTATYYGKAGKRIPSWAQKPNQINYKIIRAYFKASELMDNVTLSAMEQICSDKESHDCYVPTFRSNYAQMKFDGEKSHGKVFEDDGDIVTLWEVVEPVVLQYKNCFLKEI